ncbi:MAG TPA: carbohydrate kinase [Jatrophihabitans sp.]|nr:carbohydrate kinase [Jatrophihabitans sp.]
MVCVIGEALIDLVLAAPAVDASGTDGYLAHPGGSPYNVAIGLARLGQHCRLLARLSGDAFGRQLRAHAEANRVDLSLAVNAGEPSTLAVVSLDAQRNASYDFYRTGTADWQWTAAELARIPDDAGWLHTGSLASWTEPGANLIEARLAELKPSCLISFDPNIRPALMGERDQAVARIERLVALSDVVKVSAEDLAWLYPGTELATALAGWRDLGPSLVVLTDGGRGARLLTADGAQLNVPAVPVPVVDTVGAGDAFMAGLINALVRDEVLKPDRSGEPSDDAVRAAVTEASLVAALTCSRAGANPPTAVELAAAR